MREATAMRKNPQDLPSSPWGFIPSKAEAFMGIRTRYLGVLLGAFLVGAGCSGQVGGTTGTGGDGNPGSGGGIVGPGSGGTGQGSGGTGGGIVTGGGGASTACAPLAAVSRRLWRLSATQYANAARDLLTLTTIPTVDTSTDGTAAAAFFSDVTKTVQPGFEYSLYQTAENILTQIAPRIPAITTTSGGCTTGQAPTACAMAFAQTFGLKAFRRPLDTTEVANLMNVYTVGAMQDFNTGISLMIEALLLSPSFIYRSELGPSTLVADASGNYPNTTLTPYEVATQLGFLLVNSTPDQMLLTAAASTSATVGLNTAAGIAAQVTRLLGTPTAKANLTNITVDWFNLRQMFIKTKDVSFLSTLPTADQMDQSGIENDLLTSAQMFIADVYSSTGKITDLLTSQKMFVNQRLATLYGLTYAGTTAAPFAAATWSPSQNRSGLLTQPSFLWALSDPSKTSIVKRGKYIHDDIVCQDPGPEPPTSLGAAIAAAQMMFPDETSLSNHRITTQPCQGCHQDIDPYSRTLQNFGPIGDYRTMADGLTVDPTGTFLPTSPLGAQTVTGAPAMMKALINSKVFTGCAVQKMVSYTLGDMIRTNNTCELQTIRTQFDQSDGTLTSLFNTIAAANFVHARTGGPK
jgi:hypothetical protein